MICVDLKTHSEFSFIKWKVFTARYGLGLLSFHRACFCDLCGSQNTQRIELYKVESVYCAVRTGSLDKTLHFVLERLTDYFVNTGFSMIALRLMTYEVYRPNFKVQIFNFIF